MHTPPKWWAATAALCLAVCAGRAQAHETGSVATIPVKKGKVTLAAGESPKVTLTGKWKGEAPALSPFEEQTTLRLFGAFGGDSGALRLDPAMWTQTKKGWRYQDDAGSVGGIQLVDVKVKKKGGSLKVKGGGAKWLFQPKEGADPGILSATLQIGDHQWCIQFRQPKLDKKGQVKARTKVEPVVYDSTWAGIQAIFDRNGCLSPLCHGASPGQGDLDLLPDVAYSQLVNRFSERGGKLLVQPGSRQDSFLWEKLAAGTNGYDLGGRGSPMPSGLPGIAADELEAIRLWIQFGAPETGVVGGTEDVLGACLPPADPQKLEPPAPPAAGEGLQFHAPPWTIPPADGSSGLNGEGEVCYASYFNVADQIPDEFKTPCPDFWGGPTKTCYYYNRTELTQDPNSHHSIIHMYRGEYDLTWQPSQPGDTTGFQFQCHGGASDGATCDPRVPDACGADGQCYGKVISALACLGYGPPDFGRGISASAIAGTDTAPSVGGSQQPFSRNVFPTGVYNVFPAEGVIVWNSHAFNLFETPQTNEQYWNVYYAPAAERDFPAHPLFDATDIFQEFVPPFEEREYCRTVTFPMGTRLFDMTAHTHKRGRLFRVWGPGIDATCRAQALAPETCTAEPDAPFFISTDYNDPTTLNRNENPWVLDDPDPALRRFKFCSIYDNGKTNALEVKRNSTSPIPPTIGNSLLGGKCYFQRPDQTYLDKGIACVAGPQKGQPCGGDDHVCDSSPGANDGVCDACPLQGGVTTDDEMFILIGTYYCDPGSDCEAGVCVGGANMGQRCDGDDAMCPGSRCGPYTN